MLNESLFKYRVLFPENVSWIVLEMDPRSITAQPEDSLTVYAVAGVPKPRCQCVNESRNIHSQVRKVSLDHVMVNIHIFNVSAEKS